MRNHAIKYSVYRKYVLLWITQQESWHSCAGLLNLTVASVVFLRLGLRRDIALLRAHPSLLVLSTISA
jgi:hypothetical protein